MPAPAAWYLATCEQCDHMDVPFKTQIERAKWMQAHIAIGHKITWSDVVPTTEGVTDGGQDQGNVH